MHPTIKAIRLGLAVLFCFALSACSTTTPVAYSGIASSAMMTPNVNDTSGRVPYSYSQPVEWQKYNSVIIDPVELYRGPDQQFGDMKEQDKTALVRYMQAQFAEKLGARFKLVGVPAADTLRVRLTLTGAVTNTPVLGTLSRFDLAGGIYNGVQTARGREGTLTGSAIYAVEIYDAPKARLLSAFITKQYPSPWDLGASMGALAASRAGIEKGADALVEHMR